MPILSLCSEYEGAKQKPHLSSAPSPGASACRILPCTECVQSNLPTWVSALSVRVKCKSGLSCLRSCWHEFSKIVPTESCFPFSAFPS